MGDIHHDDLEVLVGRVLANPIGAEHSKTLNAPTDSFFSNRLEVSHRLQLRDSTGRLRFAIRTSFGHRPFASSATHCDPINDESLLVLVSQAPGLVRTGRSWYTMNLGKLTILPTPDTQEVSHHITLLFAVQLRHVLVCPHYFGPMHEFKKLKNWTKLIE